MKHWVASVALAAFVTIVVPSHSHADEFSKCKERALQQFGIGVMGLLFGEAGTPTMIASIEANARCNRYLDPKNPNHQRVIRFQAQIAKEWRRCGSQCF